MKSFKWTNWIKASNQIKQNGFHCLGFNLGEKFDGFHEWDLDKKGRKVKCKHKKYDSEAQFLAEQSV